MKHLILILTLVLGNQCVNAQIKVKEDANGMCYIPAKPTKAPDSLVNKEFVDADGNRYPVYKTAKNRLYVLRTSKKTGKSYKQYIEIEK